MPGLPRDRRSARQRAGAVVTADPTVFEHIRVLVSLGKFDSGGYNADGSDILRIPRAGVEISAFRPLTLQDYSPRGGTPLRDATARFIAHLDEISAANKGAVVVGLLADESGSMGGNEQSVVAGLNEFVGGMADVAQVDGEVLGKVLCVILTDGYENSSQETTPAGLAAMIAEREKRGWTFIYLGANQDAWATGQATGFSGGVTGQAVHYVATPSGLRSAMANVTGDAASYLGDNASYVKARTNSSKRSISEDGVETTTNTAGPDIIQPVSPHPAASKYGVADALRQARGEKPEPKENEE